MRKIATLAASLLVLAACSSTPDETLSGTAAATPGSEPGTTSSEMGALGSESGTTSTDLPGAAGPGTAQDFEVNVGDRVFFGYDSSVIDDKGRETLQRQATWLQQFPDVTVTIEGHTDSRGTTDYNLALGERRATAARNYLEALGVAPTRMTATTLGEERPADPSDSDQAFAANRRAVTVVNLTQ